MSRSGPKIYVLANYPSPYNEFFYQELENACEVLRVTYSSKPASDGRSWDYPIPTYGHMAQGMFANFVAARSSGREADVVIHTGSYLGRIALGRTIAMNFGGDGNHWFWGERLRTDGSKPKDAFRRVVLSRYEGILAVGRWAVESYRRIVPGRPVLVLPYLTGLRSRGLADRGRFVIGYAGSLIHRKGVDRLIRAAARVRVGQGRAIKLEIVGSGLEFDNLQTLAANLGVDVAWHGELDRERLDAVRSRWWAQVVPSRYDGWGVVVSEAMASGVPAIAWNTVGAGHDLIKDEYNGFMVASLEGLASALERIGESPAFQRHLASHAYATAEVFSAAQGAVWLREVALSGAFAEGSFVDFAWSQLEQEPPVLRLANGHRND
jgi:glycosyltransferase involved in cell wall biosynthesis